ncbi:MAG: abortive infection protein, partial [Chloroflexi bacterium]|nr:abortive infection protein [Chloroflexota bacterium]
MNRKGVCYDAGVVMGVNWRPDYSPAVVRREIEVVKAGLHCNAIKIHGRDIGRLASAAEYALRQGLEVWFCPLLLNKNQRTVLGHIARAAEVAEELRSRWPGRLVFVVGGELSIVMRGIIPGWTHGQRVQSASPALIKSRDKPLNAFLARASQAVRAVFDGPVTYAALPPERVDWDMFDLIGVNYYWREPVKDRYLALLEPLVASGKPVVVTELGFRTRTGADQTGPAGPENIDTLSMALYLFPLTRPFVRPRVMTIHERSEELQARSLTDQLELLDHAGVSGAFV